VVIRKQGLSTVDTHVPAIATTLLSYLCCRISTTQGYVDLDIWGQHGDQILSGGRHQGVRRLLPPDLHRIESAISRWEMMPVHNKRLTSIVGMCEIVCHRRAFEVPMSQVGQERLGMLGKGGEARVVLQYLGMHGPMMTQFRGWGASRAVTAVVT
jgi:hypothetical protein